VSHARLPPHLNGERRYLRRAVDQDGTVLDILVQDRRDKTAASASFAAC
jgi:putative transposase